jgi:hypothetical protein
MNFLEWMGWKKMNDDNVVKFPTVAPVAPPMPRAEPLKTVNKEHYRIGYDHDREMATLTLLDNNNYAITTLSMNRTATEQMIRMLRAAFPVEEKKNG